MVFLLFFFAGWEGHYTKTPNTRVGTLPTAAMRAGDFSSFGTTIYDPRTGNPTTGEGRTPFPNNQIPLSRMDPTAGVMLKSTGLPSTSTCSTREVGMFLPT